MTDGIRTLVSGAVSDAVFSADGSTIYAAQGGSITAYSVATGTQVGSWAVGTKLGGMDLTPDGSGVVVTERTPGQIPSPLGNVAAFKVYSLSFGTGTVRTYTANGGAAEGSAFFDVGILANGKAILSTDQTDAAPYILDLTAGTLSQATGLPWGQAVLSDGTVPTKILSTSNPLGTQYAFAIDGNGNYTGSSFTDGYYTKASAQAAVAGGNRMAISGLTGLKILDASAQLVADPTANIRAAILDGSSLTGYEEDTTFQGLAYDVGGAHLYAYAAALHAIFEFNTADWTLAQIFATGTQSDGWVANYGSRLQPSSDGHTLSVLTGGSLQLIGTAASNAHVGSSQADTLLGTSGSDVLYGHDGSDSLDGGAGADTMVGGAGDDTYYVDDAGDIVIDASGTDSIVTSIAYQPPAEVEIVRLAGSSTAQLIANDAGSRLYGNELSNVLVGQNGDDALDGGDGDDILFGSRGNDVLSGGNDNDTLVGGDGNDTAIFDAPRSAATITIDAAGRLVVSSTQGTDILSGIEMLRFNDQDVAVASLVIQGTTAQGGSILTSSASDIDAQYVTYAGRHATSAELAAWSAALNMGTTSAAMRTTIIAALGKSYVDAQIAQTYQTYGGRAPSDGEITAWENFLGSNAYDFSAIRTAVLNTPFGIANIPQLITQSYLTYAGRAPFANELAGWQSVIRSGATFDTLRQAILDDPIGQAHTQATVTAIYTSLAGRAATSAEISSANTQLRAGADFNGVRSSVLGDTTIHTYEIQKINAAYQTYAGRSPSDGERTAWHNLLVAGGGDYGTVRDAILNSALGTAYTDGQVDSAYQTYAGRHAGAGELTAWANLLNTNNHDFGVVRDAILNSSLGKAYTDGQIGQIYQTYAGRAAGANEISAWENVLNTNNHQFNAVKAAILNDPVASAYANTQIDTLYQRYFGRTASAGEEAAWRGVFQTGATFDALRDALMSSPGSAATTQQLTGTSAADTFHLPTSPNTIVLTGFDPAHDVIDLQGKGYGAINPLDSAHAHEIRTLDGSTDVLISLDSTHDILLHNIALTQLSSTDFLL